ncbi:metallophosphoesterase family protein [Bradyrhizobium betae]
MQLVHITDLHFMHGNAFQRDLIASLLADFKNLYDSGYVPDFLVFSGDLVNNPDEPSIYKLFDDDFLQPALQALGLRPEEVIFCPGNHDISHAALSAWADERRKLVEVMNGDQADLDRHLSAAPTRAYASELSSGFFELAKRCGHMNGTTHS